MREVVTVLAEAVSCVRTSDRAKGIADVQRCIHTKVIPKHFTTQGAFNAHRVTAGWIVTPTTIRVSWLCYNKAVACSCAAFFAAGTVRILDDAVEDLAVKGVDDRKACDVTIAVEIRAWILWILLLVNLKDKEIQFVEEAICVEVTATLPTLHPAPWWIWGWGTLAQRCLRRVHQT